MIIHNVEQGSEEWFRLRKAKITGTRFKEMFSSDNLKLVDKLIAETVSEEVEDPGFISEEMQRGKEYEPLARQAYQDCFGLKIDVFGFIASDKYDWIGYSPDGLIMGERETIYRKAVEIKCPSTHTHVKYIRMNQIPNEYKYQVLLIFIVCESVEQVTFVSYDPRFYKRPLWTYTVTRSEMSEEIKSAEDEIIKFRKKFDKYYEQVTF